MTRLTRSDLDALPTYVPGRNVADLARELGLTEAIKLASNEVPYGPLPGVVEAVTDAMVNSHRYPDMGVVQLRDKLASRFGVAADRLVTGCGSVALAEHLIKATCLPGDEIVYSWRSFEAYPIIAAGAAATSVPVPNDAGHGHDLRAMAAAITDRTRVVFVCNPNNPTGTAVRRDELDRFVAAVPSDVLIVLDEA
jgi:histidinol-phosphate aminotransferase